MSISLSSDSQTLSRPLRDTDDLSVWPRSARPGPDGDVCVGGVSLAEAADRFGTPLYVLDEEEVRERCRTYRTAFPEADVVYAAKAFLCRAVAHWVKEEGLGLDVCSAGELELAVTTGFPPEKIVMHGNAKSPEDLLTAVRLGAGRIVVDSASEIARLSAITARRATYWRTACRCRVTYARATCSRYPRPVRTTCPWPPVTTLSAGLPSSPSRTATHGCSYAVNRWTT